MTQKCRFFLDNKHKDTDALGIYTIMVFHGAYESSFVQLSHCSHHLKVLFFNNFLFFTFYVRKHGNSHEEVIMWVVQEDEKWKFMLFDSNCRCHCHCSMKIPFIYCMIHFFLTLVPFMFHYLLVLILYEPSIRNGTREVEKMEEEKCRE